MAELEASPYETKTCLSCKLTKFTSKDFEFQNKICKDCKKEKKNNKLREDEKSYIAYLCSKAKSRAKEKNLEYNLDPEAILSIPTHCPVFGSPIVPFSKGPNSPSIDRIDPNRGYTMDNIIIISHRANTIKNDASPEELRTIANWLECQIDMKKRHYGE